MPKSSLRNRLLWTAALLLATVPLVFAAKSPLLQWREPIYIMAGLAGVVGMILLLAQPILAAGLLRGIPRQRAHRLHRWSGVLLLAAIVLHVAGLWITSPPDVIDALTFTSPTPFAAWGVIAMWAAFAAAGLAIYRRKLRLWQWRIGHSVMITLVVTGTVIHALLIEGTMEPYSKIVLSCAVLVATCTALSRLKPWTGRPPRAGAD